MKEKYLDRLRRRQRSAIGPATLAVLIVLAIIAVVIIGITGSTFLDVPTGDIAIIRNTYQGTLTIGPVGPLNAPFQKSPFFTDVILVQIAVDGVVMDSVYSNNANDSLLGIANGANQLSPIGITKDGIQVAVSLQVQWTINASDTNRIINLYRNYPNLDYKNVIVSYIDKVVRDVIGNHTFDEIYNDRTVLPGPITNGIISEVSANPTLSGTIIINPSQVQLNTIHIPFAIAQQLESKKNAQIAQITAEYQRNVTVINAQAQANAAVQVAQGQALAVEIAANASRIAILTNVEALCPNCNSTYLAKVAQYYYELVTLQQMARQGTTFVLTQQGGQYTLLQIPVNGVGNTTTFNYPSNPATPSSSTNSTGK